MIAVPSVVSLPHVRLYRDSGDARIFYADVFAPRQGKGARWMPIPGGQAYLAGEVRFGLGPEDPGDVFDLAPNQRLLSMPWKISPMIAWYPEGRGVHVVARGKTSGFGQSNAVFSGSAPLGAMISPVLVAAELVCDVRIVEAEAHGSGGNAGLEAALEKSPLGSRASWDSTLGGVLIEMLTGLLGSGDLTLQVRVFGPRTAVVMERTAELRDLVLLEWAHRLQVLLAPEQTLAAPAASVKPVRLAAPPAFDVNLLEGDIAALRTVRLLRPIESGRTAPEVKC